MHNEQYCTRYTAIITAALGLLKKNMKYFHAEIKKNRFIVQNIKQQFIKRYCAHKTCVIILFITEQRQSNLYIKMLSVIHVVVKIIHQ